MSDPKPISSRRFALYALSLPRGPNFDPLHEVSWWADERGAAAGIITSNPTDGSFGYWTSFDTGNFWLTAYAVDFMQHARAAGVNVPPEMEERATSWLAGQFATVGFEPRE